ncbi:hypothetical protein AVEN_251192-1, partial [Araneus ventricosus]
VERFKRDPELYREYGEVINGYLEEGIVERCTSERLADESSFYLPHHAVVRDDKVSSRLRIVFDGASHAEGQYSLNDCLNTGPNLYPNLFELLIKFRENAVTYIADIRQAFLQILIDAEDRPFTRFFWKEDLNSDKLTVLNFTRVLFGLTPSPYLLAATLKYHFEKNIDLFPETCESLLKSFWVDDLVGGADDVEQALKTTTESVKILKDAGMILRKWQTNSKELREDWKKIGIETHEDKTTLARDASLAAYGTVLYLRGVTRNGKIIVNFLCSKSRVAPLKSLTLPRLELLGCLLSARLAEQVSKCLKFEASCYFWTDSSICTYWIKGKADDYKPFVKNRVKEIQRLSERGNWSHCPGKENPADLLSRGIPASNLAKSSLWWHGPPWLSKPSEFWPCKIVIESPMGNLELRKEFQTVSQNKCVVYDSQFVFDLNKYSDLNKVLVITTLVKRFVNKLRKLPTEVGPCSAAELLEAEQDWIKFEQNLVCSSELERIKSGKQISKNSSLYKLAPYLDDNNVLRVRGRLEESEFSSNEIHPIILPKQSKFSELLIRREHNKVCHGGVSATLSKIRSRYCIPKGRQIVKRVLRDCLICRKYSLKPAQQITAQLPKNRILENPPFTVTGIDFTGPVIIRSVKESNQKSYITLFTCAVTRALHLELTTDMTTKHFILSLRRFLARRGNCKVIISDNAKSFKATDNILREFAKILVDVDLKKFVGIHEITWQFIPPHAPWWGGFYERLMRSIKEPLRKILGRASLSFEEMTTILAEVELVLNHRPLTYTSNDLDEPLPLTPAHFLFPGQENLSYPVHFLEIFTNQPSTKENLTRRVVYQTKLLRHIWGKWKNNYLMQLRNAHNFVNSSPVRDLKKGEVVLLEGTTKSKFLWPLGVIEDVIVGRDGHIRSCIVRTSKGQLKRPIQLIYPLEII